MFGWEDNTGARWRVGSNRTLSGSASGWFIRHHRLSRRPFFLRVCSKDSLCLSDPKINHSGVYNNSCMCMAAEGKFACIFLSFGIQLDLTMNADIENYNRTDFSQSAVKVETS